MRIKKGEKYRRKKGGKKIKKKKGKEEWRKRRKKERGRGATGKKEKQTNVSKWDSNPVLFLLKLDIPVKDMYKVTHR